MPPPPSLSPALTNSLLTHTTALSLNNDTALLVSEALRLFIVEAVTRASAEALSSVSPTLHLTGESADSGGDDENTVAIKPNHVLAIASSVVADFS